jgi:hypothetical protein
MRGGRGDVIFVRRKGRELRISSLRGVSTTKKEV